LGSGGRLLDYKRTEPPRRELGEDEEEIDPLLLYLARRPPREVLLTRSDSSSLAAEDDDIEDDDDDDDEDEEEVPPSAHKGTSCTPSSDDTASTASTTSHTSNSNVMNMLCLDHIMDAVSANATETTPNVKASHSSYQNRRSTVASPPPDPQQQHHRRNPSSLTFSSNLFAPIDQIVSDYNVDTTTDVLSRPSLLRATSSRHHRSMNSNPVLPTMEQLMAPSSSALQQPQSSTLSFNATTRPAALKPTMSHHRRITTPFSFTSLYTTTP